MVDVPDPVPRELLTPELATVFTLKVPALIVTAPENVLEFVNSIVPVSNLVIPPVQLTIPLTKISVAVVPSSATENDLTKAPKAIGHDMVALSVPVVASLTVMDWIENVPVPIIEEPVVAPPNKTVF